MDPDQVAQTEGNITRTSSLQLLTSGAFDISRIGFVVFICLANLFVFGRLPALLTCPRCSVVTAVTSVNIVQSLLTIITIVLEAAARIPGMTVVVESCLAQVAAIHLLTFTHLVTFTYLLIHKFGSRILRNTTFKFVPMLPFLTAAIFYYICAIIYLTNDEQIYFFKRRSTLLKVSSQKSMYELDITMSVCHGDLGRNMRLVFGHYVFLVLPFVVVVVVLLIGYARSRRTVDAAYDTLEKHAEVEFEKMAAFDNKNGGCMKTSGATILNLEPQKPMKPNHDCVYGVIEHVLLILLSMNFLWEALCYPVFIYTFHPGGKSQYAEVGSNVLLGVIATVVPSAYILGNQRNT